MNNIKELARTIIVIMILVAGVSLVSAWTAPTQAPPGGNVAAPVNVGALSQVKTGALQVNGFRNIGNSIFDGSVGIGTVSPTQKLDVNGDIKTNAGIWLGGVRRTNWPSGGGTVVTSGLYGSCSNGGSSGCSDSLAPAFCSGFYCSCPSGYTPVTTGYTPGTGSDPAGWSRYVSCYKN